MASGMVMVVEDERSIASLVEMYLRKEGFDVALVSDGSKAIAEIERVKPALVILDVMLPGTDGIEICRRLRATGSIPIIMLTARDADVRIIGLELGADDYVTKPFNPRELVARVKAVLRRADAPPQPNEVLERLSLGPILVDCGRRAVNVGSREVELTPKEFDLLVYLIRNRGIVFTRDRLLERVWGYERAVDTRTIDSHVRSLRSKLGPEGALVKTLRGVGYKADT
jgi:DNA-binding response OmpR family regulator